MANITLGNLRDLWKAVSDWVTGVSASQPNITIANSIPAGSNIIGQVKLTDGTNAVVVDTNGSLQLVPVDSTGVELFTDTNPGIVALNGSKTALSSTPETGTKTVTSTAAEIFAGTARKAGRSMMYIRNTHDSIAIRIGASDISDTKGRRVLPQQEVKIEFDPQSDIPLYAISEYGNVEVEVFEA